MLAAESPDRISDKDKLKNTGNRWEAVVENKSQTG